MADGQVSGQEAAGRPVTGHHGRVLMIGLDAYTLDFARRHLDQLPVLRDLLQSAGARPLTAPGARMSASVWATFAAAAPPGVHGHYYPYQWRPDQMGFRRTSTVPIPDSERIEPFWRDIARAGAKVISFDIGVPLDPSDAPCLEIVNWSSQSNGAALSSDPRALADLRRRYGRRPIGKEVPVPKKLSRSRRIRDGMIRALDSKTEASIHLGRSRPWDLFLVGFYEIHRAGHNLLRVENDFASAVDPDALLDVYKAQDRALARLLDALGGDDVTVAIFALHSIEPNRAQDHFIRDALVRLNARWLEEQGAPALAPKGPNLMARLRAALPADLQYALAHLLGERVQDYVVGRSYIGGLDWPRTLAMAHPAGGEWYIRFNVKGRERDGALDLATPDGQRFVEWLHARLREIRVAETGAPLVADIVDLHRAFPGPRSAVLPDLLVRCAPEEPVTAIVSPAIGRIARKLGTGRGGNHHAGEAFFIATGPAATSARLEEVRDIADLGAFAASALSLAAPRREKIRA